MCIKLVLALEIEENFNEMILLSKICENANLGKPVKLFKQRRLIGLDVPFLTTYVTISYFDEILVITTARFEL